MPSPKCTKSPAFQFYPNDFLSSSKVGRMSMAERGVYITLLSYCWMDGGLPSATGILARLVGMPARSFVKMWTTGSVGQCFYEKHGRLFNQRLDDERAKQEAHKRRQSDNGKQGGRPKKENPKEAVGSSGLTQHEPTKSSSSSSSSSSTPPHGGVAHPRAMAPIHDSAHKKHALCGRVCLHAGLFGDFVRRRNHDDAAREIDAWALGVIVEWTSGLHASDEPGDAFDFWKARYDERWPAADVAASPRRLPAWAKPKASA